MVRDAEGRVGRVAHGSGASAKAAAHRGEGGCQARGGRDKEEGGNDGVWVWLGVAPWWNLGQQQQGQAPRLPRGLAGPQAQARSRAQTAQEQQKEGQSADASGRQGWAQAAAQGETGHPKEEHEGGKTAQGSVHGGCRRARQETRQALGTQRRAGTRLDQPQPQINSQTGFQAKTAASCGPKTERRACGCLVSQRCAPGSGQTSASKGQPEYIPEC
jgi:hypothetical protein